MPNASYKPDAVDGRKLWMVAMECIMTLFALLYAFPHIPGTLLEEGETEEGNAWFNVTSTEALRAALEGLLKTSEVLEYSLPYNRSMKDVGKEVFTAQASHDGESVHDPHRLSKTFQLQLNDSDVPATCRQMYARAMQGSHGPPRTISPPFSMLCCGPT